MNTNKVKIKTQNFKEQFCARQEATRVNILYGRGIASVKKGGKSMSGRMTKN